MDMITYKTSVEFQITLDIRKEFASIVGSLYFVSRALLDLQANSSTYLP